MHTGSPVTNISPKIWSRKHLPGPGVHWTVCAAKAWLITTLRRKNARRFARKPLEVTDIDVDTLEASSDQENSPEARALGRALANFSRDYRDPLLLQIIGGFSVVETAKEMNLSSGAVTAGFFRAR